jgi:hypothetical protein
MGKTSSTFFSASVLSVLMVMAVPHPTRAAEGTPGGRYLFEYCQSSSAAGQTLLGFYVDQDA